jgi:hypothetical protein
MMNSMNKTAISTVHIGMWGADGAPKPTIKSAICHTCGDWATHVWAASTNEGDTADLFVQRVSRTVRTLVYACDQHGRDISDALCDEFGFAVNRYDPDELAKAVDRADRQTPLGDSAYGVLGS